MKILTSREMREIDRKAIEDLGIPGAILMEAAGARVTEALLGKFPRPEGERVVVVAGKGNNGGDGLVVARLLKERGGQPFVLLLAAKAAIKGDAALNLRLAEKAGVEVAEVETLQEWKSRRGAVIRASIIVDAIFGTGLTKPAEGLPAAAIGDINKARGFKLAVDIPSGLSADTFKVIGPAVKADLTVTLAAPKVALVFPPAEEFVGELVIADIGIPPCLLDDRSLALQMVERADVARVFRKRPRDTHKGSYGHLLVLAGSVGKTGASVLASKAAYRTGAGLVTTATAARCLPVIARAMLELMTEPLAETAEGTIAEAALPRVLDLLTGKDALLVGPGLSTHRSTAALVRALLPRVKVPLVIDADGLNIVAQDLDVLGSLKAPAVLTPHPGEFGRLTGLTVKAVLDDRLELAPRFARDHGVYLVLKGYRTLVATPQGRVFVNPTGNPGLATGGSGDVLSGILASLLMQEKDLERAVFSAVYLHGLAGDIAAARLGERALIAGDLIRYLPKAVKSLEDAVR